MLFYQNLRRVGIGPLQGTVFTGRIGADGSYSYRSGPYGGWPFFTSLTPVFGHGFLTYEYSSGRTRVVLLDPGTNTHRVVSVTGMRPQWSSLVATKNDMLVLYNYQTGDWNSGNLVPETANSFRFVPRQGRLLDRGWSHVVALP